MAPEARREGNGLMTALPYWRQQVRGALQMIRLYRWEVGAGRRKPSHEEYGKRCAEVHKARRRWKIELKNARHEQRRAA